MLLQITLFGRWKSAEIVVMGAQGAVEIIHKKEVGEYGIESERIKNRIKEFEEKFLTPMQAAEVGFIDAVIEPCETRKKLISSLSFTITKRESLPRKKHSNCPV